MEMRELHGEVARLQTLGLAFLDVKAEIGRVVAAQQACRDALATAKAASSSCGGGSSSGDTEAEECWVLRPGGVWLRLPAARAEGVLREGARRATAVVRPMHHPRSPAPSSKLRSAPVPLLSPARLSGAPQAAPLLLQPPAAPLPLRNRHPPRLSTRPAVSCALLLLSLSQHALPACKFAGTTCVC